jgi:hypothetical protein
MKSRILPIILVIHGFLLPRVVLAKPLEWSAQMEAHPTSITSNGFDLVQPEVKILLKNTGTQAWDSKNEKLRLTYHVYDDRGNVVRYDNQRFDAPNLKPLQQAWLDVPLPSDLPPDPRRKSVRFDFDLVREGLNWFSLANPANHFPKVSLVTNEISLSELRAEPAMRKSLDLSVGIKSIDLATSLAYFTVERAKKVYVMPSGRFTVLTAGAGYSQAWIRDCATGVRAAYLVVGDAAARDCASLHMLKQRDDGYVNDFIDSAGKVDKTTVEADQESSLVIAVSDYVDITKKSGFLDKKINRESVIEHLHAALNYVWVNERDSKTGLVKSGHTIDWGDVSIDGADQSAVYLNKNSHLVVGIYTNAMYALAIRDYINLISKCDQTDNGNIKLWKERLDVLKRSIVANLWSSERGYFLMHRNLTPISLPVNEDDMFAMGGNAVAIEAGITTPEMTNSIFDTALHMKEKFNAPTISGVLYPPYPDGVYKHPSVVHPFEYQNGGAWDWFGLRLISDMLENGRAVDACKALNEIATKVVRNRTFSEWDARDGRAMGSKDYMGAASEYISAVVQFKEYAEKQRNFLDGQRIAGSDPCASLH